MYSPTQMTSQQQQQPAFDVVVSPATIASIAGNCGYLSTTTNATSPATMMPAAAAGTCLYPSLQDMSYDYMRRFSYAELLSNHSEASMSDTETPSPVMNEYEEYCYLQQQHQPQAQPQVLMAHGGKHHDSSSASPYLEYPSYWPAMFTSTMYGGYFGDGGCTDSNGGGVGTVIPESFSLPTLMAMTTPESPGSSTGVLMSSSSSSNRSDCSSPPSLTHPATTKTNSATVGGGIKRKNKPSSSRSRGRRVSTNNNSGMTGQKMFTCEHDECGKIFKRSEHLKRHVRSIHTQEKPYECPYHACSKRFSRSDNLNQHIRIHRHTSKDKSSSSTTTTTTTTTSSSSSSTSSSSPMQP